MPLDKVSGQSVTQASGGSGVDSSYKVPSLSGVTSSSYPQQTPPPLVGTGQGRGQGVVGPDAQIGNYTADQAKLIDLIGNGYLAKDAQGNWYNPRAATGIDAFLESIIPIATAVLGTAGFAGAFGAGAASAAAGTGEVAASTTAAGEAAAATTAALPEVAGTLGEVVVPVSGGVGALGSIGAVAPELGAIGAIGTADLSGATLPTINAGSSTLQKIGMSALKQGGINAAISTVMGGNPIKGFESGFISGGITGGLGAFEAGSGALDALGNTGIKAVNAAIAGAGTAAIMGGNPLLSGVTGGVSSLAGSALSDILGTGGNKFDVGQALGSAAGSIAVSQILGGGKVPNFRTTGGGIGAQTTPSVTKPAPDQSFDPYAATNIPSIRDTPITYPSVPYYGVGYRAGGGDVASSDDEGYFQNQDKLKKLLAALMQQQGGAYG